MIYLKRNNKIDSNFSAMNNTDYVKHGYIYQLLEVTRNVSIKPMVLLKIKGVSGDWLELTGTLDCFDYVKQS